MTEIPPLGAPANRALDELGVKSLEDLTAFSASELLALHGFGPKGLRLLNEALGANGLTLRKD
jgi:hypothetical protein